MLAIDEARNVVASHLPHGSGLGRDLENDRLNVPGDMIDLSHVSFQNLPELLNRFPNSKKPTEKRTLEDLTKLRNIHQAASSFWKEIIGVSMDFMRIKPGSSSAKYLSEYNSEKYLADFRAVYDQLAAEVKQKDRTKIRPDDVEALAEQIAPAPQLDTVDDAVDDDDNATTPVCSESAVIFARMYTRSGDARKSTKWDDLTAALVDAGFSVEHTRGSAVRFEHATKGSVTLHRPHPHPVLNLIHLRAIGKRCWKWFGWDQGTFVERE
ncbi:hypothetical protein B0A55_08531 [Friedmanniomyces simplex]|uniref:Uncharacterized protein n=1 Tax=Friedmanniomyces simplex TaxID=329884 RepID=A0A4U0X718_9PEZI|nr:hypothetical protein B0A55_08531 [Friedmanniomyces simplex]